MKHVEGRCSKVVFVRLYRGEDLTKSLRRAAEERNIVSGAFFAIGTLSQVSFHFYYPKPNIVTLKKPFEIVACSGIIFRHEYETQVHGHIDVVDSELKSQGGHLLEGSIVDVLAFVVIFELEGADLSMIGL